MRKFLVLFLSALLFFVFASESSAQPKDVSNYRLTTVTVSGDARIMAEPDTAIVSISVVTQNRNAVAAQQQNAVQTTAVINALKRAAGSGAESKRAATR